MIFHIAIQMATGLRTTQALSWQLEDERARSAELAHEIAAARAAARHMRASSAERAASSDSERLRPLMLEF